LNVKYQGAEFNYYSRDDSLFEQLAPLANRLLGAIEEAPNLHTRAATPPSTS